MVESQNHQANEKKCYIHESIYMKCLYPNDSRIFFCYLDDGYLLHNFNTLICDVIALFFTLG